MFYEFNRLPVLQDQILHWTMQGLPGQNAGIEFSLQIHFVQTGEGKRGFVINPLSMIPDDIELGPQREGDTINYKGMVMLLEGRELNVTFQENIYTILQLVEVQTPVEQGGIMYFHSYPPQRIRPDATGDIYYNGGGVLESAIG